MPIREEIEITADNKTAKAFREVQNSAKKTADDLGQLSLKLGAIVAAGAAAAAGLYLLTKRAVENTRELQVNADMAGVNVEAYQELTFAASQYRITQEALTDGLKELSLRADEFATTGKGSAAEAFERLGFTTSEVNNLLGDTPTLLTEIAGRMEGLGEAAQIRISDELFGGQGGEQFKALLADGADGIERLRNEARDLGLVLDQDAVAGAERVSRALSRMEQVVSANLQRALVEFAPSIESLAEAFADAAPKILDVANSILKLFFGVEALSLQGLRDELHEVTNELRDYRAEVGDLSKLTDEEFKQYKEKFANYEQEILKLRELIEVREKEQEARENLLRTPPPPTGDIVDETVENEKKRAAAWIEQINETYARVSLTEEELIDRQAARQLEKLKELNAKKLIEDMAYLEAEGAIYSTAFNKKLELYDREAEAWEEMNERRNRADEQNYRQWESIQRMRQREARKALGNLASLMDSHSRKAFEVGKAAAIAETIVNTYLAAQKAYTAFAWFPPLGAAMAAAAIAAGFARVQAIKSTSFGGGGSVSSAGGGGTAGGRATATARDIPELPPATQTQPTRELNLTLVGHSITTVQVRDELLPMINEAVKDGHSLTINTTVTDS